MNLQLLAPPNDDDGVNLCLFHDSATSFARLKRLFQSAGLTPRLTMSVIAIHSALITWTGQPEAGNRSSFSLRSRSQSGQNADSTGRDGENEPRTSRSVGSAAFFLRGLHSSVWSLILLSVLVVRSHKPPHHTFSSQLWS
ncbi:unnamed protein product [Protopolystoma xenopodis]|uniref:Uncharacterized protein n=1 Tax=Protopolystoma xenopodis TaxID=117903 RepID=A0A448XDM6_9PLAT|nr:unnamed protein product [Protopolystoma xenopodis]